MYSFVPSAGGQDKIYQHESTTVFSHNKYLFATAGVIFLEDIFWSTALENPPYWNIMFSQRSDRLHAVFFWHFCTTHMSGPKTRHILLHLLQPWQTLFSTEIQTIFGTVHFRRKQEKRNLTAFTSELLKSRIPMWILVPQSHVGKTIKRLEIAWRSLAMKRVAATQGHILLTAFKVYKLEKAGMLERWMHLQTWSNFKVHLYSRM